MGPISGGFIPSLLDHVFEYVATLPELVVSGGVSGIGLLLPTVFLKVAVATKTERAQGMVRTGRSKSPKKVLDIKTDAME